MIPKLYKRLLLRCKTVNQLNQLHISLENRLTPTELEALFLAYPEHDSLLMRLIPIREFALKILKLINRSVPVKGTMGKRRVTQTLDWTISERLPKQSLLWLAQMRRWSNMSGGCGPEAFKREKLFRDVFSYSSGGDSKKKTLLICFAGKEGRMMMPLPTFLQNLDARKFDVILIRDHSRQGYRYGLSGLGDDIFSVANKLGKVLRVREYKSSTGLGISAGGIPVVVMGIMLNLDRVLSIGTLSPEDPVWIHYGGDTGLPGWLRQEAVKNSLKETFLVYGTDSEEDRIAATCLHSYLPEANLLKISSKHSQRKIYHNVLYNMLDRCVLRGFLQEYAQPNGAIGSDDELRHQVEYRI